MSDDYDVARDRRRQRGLDARRSRRADSARACSCSSARRARLRGGNSRHTRNLRCAHAAPTEILTDAYPEAGAARGPASASTAARPTKRSRRSSRLARRSACRGWRRSARAFRRRCAARCTSRARTRSFFGGGTALMNSYYAAAERLGIDVRYDAEVTELTLRDGTFRVGDRAHRAAHRAQSARNAVVVASGGFEANLEWLREAWGDAARNFLIRGTPYNTGTMLRALLDAGAATDRRRARMPRRRDRRPRAEVRRRHRHAARLRAARHRRQSRRRAVLRRGRGLLAEALRDLGQARRAAAGPDRLLDRRRQGARPASCRRCIPPIEAASIRELAAQLGLPAERLEATVAAFNRAVQPGAFDTRRSTTAAPRGSRRRSRIGRSGSTRRRTAALSAAARHHVHVSRRARERLRARARGGRRAVRRTSTRPARSWPATSCGRAILRASA